MKSITKMTCLAVGVLALLTGAVTAQGRGGVTFYQDRNFSGQRSGVFDYGTYTMAQMIANRCPNDWANSLTFSDPYAGDNSGYVALCYSDDNFSGGLSVFAEEFKVMSANSMSSIKIQNSVPSGHVWRSAPGQYVEFQAGYLLGDWDLFHNGDNVTLSSSGDAHYTARYETEYWQGSGNINPPTIQVLSGSNTLHGTSGKSDPGTCTGTAFPWEAYYDLNGTVKWVDNESGCAYNIGLRDGGW